MTAKSKGYNERIRAAAQEASGRLIAEAGKEPRMAAYMAAETLIQTIHAMNLTGPQAAIIMATVSTAVEAMYDPESSVQ